MDHMHPHLCSLLVLTGADCENRDQPGRTSNILFLGRCRRRFFQTIGKVVEVDRWALLKDAEMQLPESTGKTTGHAVAFVTVPKEQRFRRCLRSKQTNEKDVA